jgi:hypothetical protein
MLVVDVIIFNPTRTYILGTIGDSFRWDGYVNACLGEGRTLL